MPTKSTGPHSNQTVMLASYAAMALALLHITDNGPIGQTCSILGGMTVPAAMLIIGSTLAKMPVREMLFDGWSYLTTLIRLIVVPVGVYFVFGLFVSDPYLLAILVLLAAMARRFEWHHVVLAYGWRHAEPCRAEPSSIHGILPDYPACYCAYCGVAG